MKAVQREPTVPMGYAHLPRFQGPGWKFFLSVQPMARMADCQFVVEKVIRGIDGAMAVYSA